MPATDSPVELDREPGLEEMSARALAREASEQAVEYEGRWYSWGEMRHVADRIEALLDASGADPRAPIAFIPRNRPSALAALLGLIALGRTIRMIYVFQSPAGIARNIQSLAPAVVLAAAEDFSEEVRSALHAQGSAAIALEDMDANAVPGFEHSLVVHDPNVSTEPRIEILTSGTTGPPKQFALSYDVIAKHYVGKSLFRSDEDDDPSLLPPNLFFFPLGNISGIYSSLPALLGGLRTILLDRFTVAGWHEYILRFRPQRSGVPPAAVQMVLDANIPPEDLASIKTFGTGAAPLDPTVQRAFEERYGIPILLSYGATEFGGPVTAMTVEQHAEWGKRKFGSVGRPLPGVQMRTIDPETGAILPPGKEGILEVISPRIGPGWIRTADVAMIDEDGFLYHRGRADGAIVRGGFKLLPETIERALLEHPAISAASVVGIKDKRLGQVPGAAVQLKPGKQATAAELETHLREHVLATHIPTVWRFVESLPKTPSMKIDRPAVQRLFASAEPA